MEPACRLPVATGEVGLKVLKKLARHRSLLSALEVMRAEVGPAFQITLPGFRPAILVGPASNRQILVSERDSFHWRSDSDPVTRLLRQGVLVVDGERHDGLRAQMEPVLQKGHVMQHVPAITEYTDRVIENWRDGSVYDMLVEMRRAALLIFVGTLFDADFGADLQTLWQPILRTIKYISPGFWIIWPNMPRPGYKGALQQMDDYLYRIIRERRLDPRGDQDLLGRLVRQPEMSDDLIRDQLLTMLIAGHDTSTALLAWALYLLGQHPAVMAKAQAEVDQVVGASDPSAQHLAKLNYLDMVIKEALRLYPPIHVGNRIVAHDATVAGYELQAGTRTMVSIYLSHRDERYWDDPESFQPERFQRGARRPPPLTYIPFGGGPRNCIGAAFAQVEAKVVLCRILQRYTLRDVGRPVHPYMGATLEPHPGVFMSVERRLSHG